MAFCLVATTAAANALHITALLIEKSGLWHADPNGQQTQAQCALFHPTQAALLRWFRHARQVTKHAWLEELDWTQCSASGTLSTADGNKHLWELDQSGRARVVMSPGQPIYLGGPELPFVEK